MVEPRDQPSEEPQVPAALVGTVLGERYRLERVLGAGGMGAVLEGRDVRLGRAVAVKVMQPGYARDAEYVKRFLREAQAASMIRHRNVVVVLDYGEAEGGIVYSVMERLVGQDLEKLLRGQPGQRMAWSQACGLLVQIASGLRAAHAQGVIHRDVKPANCFLTTEDDEPVVKVVDFGIAKLGEGLQTQQLTGTGDVLGTPSYTAPEMVLTGGPASPRSDVYSLGVVAYRMLTGRLPFTGKTAFEVMHHACILPVPGMREAGLEVPGAVEALVLEMLSKTPDERPADMGEVRQRLVTLGREIGGVPATVEGVGSGGLRIDAGAAISGSGPVTRTEVLDSGRLAVGVSTTESRDRTTEVRAAAAVPVVAEVASGGVAERTEVVIGAGFREPAGWPLAPPVMASPGPRSVAAEVDRTEVLDSSKVERSPRKGAAWLVGAGVLVAVVSGGVTWVMASGERTPDSKPRDAGGDAVAVVEAEPWSQERTQPPVEAKQSETNATKAVTLMPVAVGDGDEGSGSNGVLDGGDGTSAALVDDVGAPKVVAPPKSVGKPNRPKPPAGPPSDTMLKKKLARKIKANCAAELAGKGVTVVFDVTTSGGVKRLTAMPKGAAETCAKRQVLGTKFRTRGSETNIEIEVK